jgi:hypothetical protein
VDKLVPSIMYLDIPIYACVSYYLIHVSILYMPCMVPKDSGGAPHDQIVALCIPNANSTMCICYAGAFSLSYEGLEFT